MPASRFFVPAAIVLVLCSAPPAQARDSSLHAITGLFAHPDGHALEEGDLVAGVTYRDDDNTGDWEWIPSVAAGVAEHWELGAWYVLSSESAESGGISAKYELHSLTFGPEDLALSAYYVGRSQQGADHHRLGAAATIDFPAGLGMEGIREAEATLGVFYDLATGGDEGDGDAGEGIDYFVGLQMPLSANLTAVLEYEPEAGVVQGEGWSAGLRYDFGPWLLQAGYESREDPFIGGQWRF
ncbi:MAG TPA: hypothetical protein VEI97_19910 [bacterium]|nr:hypothetical protein [bacterium]